MTLDMSSFDAPDTPALVCGGLLVLCFVIGSSRGRSTWFLVDLLATMAFGLGWYFIPDVILGFQINVKPDGTHLTYTRAFAAAMIGDAVSRYMIRSSDHASPILGLLLSRIGGCAVLLISMGYIQLFGGGIFNQYHIFFGMLGNLLWMMGSVVYFYQTRNTGCDTQTESRLDLHLRIDGLVILLIGCTIYAFPDLFLMIQTTLETYDGVHLHMARATGALLIGSSILSFMAPGFALDTDKRALFTGRLVKILLTVLAVLYAAASYDEWGQNLHVYLAMESVLVVNALLGLQASHQAENIKQN